MSDISAQIAKARAAKYTDDEIIAAINRLHPDLAPKIKAAQGHAYSSADIIGFLGKSAEPPASPAQGPEKVGALGHALNAWKSFKEYLPSAAAPDWPELGPQFRAQVSNAAHSIAEMPQKTWEAFGRAGQAMVHGDVPNTAWHIAGGVPVLGPQTQQVATDVHQGDWDKAAGHLAGATLPVWGPKALDAGSAAVDTGSVAAGGALKGGWDTATEMTPIRIHGIERSIPSIAVNATAGAGMGEVFGVPAKFGGTIGALAPIVKGAVKGGKAALRTRAMKEMRLAAGEGIAPSPMLPTPPEDFPSIVRPFPSGRIPGPRPSPPPVGRTRISSPQIYNTQATPRSVPDFEPIPSEGFPSGRVPGTGEPAPPPPPVVRQTAPGLGPTPRPVIEMAPMPEGGVQFRQRPSSVLPAPPEPRVSLADQAGIADAPSSKLPEFSPTPNAAHPSGRSALNAKTPVDLTAIKAKFASDAKLTPEETQALQNEAVAKFKGTTPSPPTPPPAEVAPEPVTPKQVGTAVTPPEEQINPTPAPAPAPAPTGSLTHAEGDVAYTPPSDLPAHYGGQRLQEHGTVRMQQTYAKDVKYAEHLLGQGVTPEAWAGMDAARQEGFLKAADKGFRGFGKAKGSRPQEVIVSDIEKTMRALAEKREGNAMLNPPEGIVAKDAQAGPVR